MSVVAKRVPVNNSAPEVVVGEDSITGTAEYTVLNTHATKTVELVASVGAAFGTGFPLAPGAAWSARCSPTEKLWVVAGDSTTVQVAVIGISVP